MVTHHPRCLWCLDHHAYISLHMGLRSVTCHPTQVNVVVVVVVVMTSPSATAYMGGQRGPEDMRNSTRL